MSSLAGRTRNGQTMVQVAVLMLVFLALLVIAIDMGHIFTERRRMQNAADAGALAGAWEVCFGDPDRAELTAREYAIDRNGVHHGEEGHRLRPRGGNAPPCWDLWPDHGRHQRPRRGGLWCSYQRLWLVAYRLPNSALEAIVPQRMQG